MKNSVLVKNRVFLPKNEHLVILVSSYKTMNFSLCDLEASLSAIEVQRTFRSFDHSVQRALIQFLRDEFSAFDDDFSIIVEEILQTLNAFMDLETKVDELISRMEATKVYMVLQAIIDYMKDVYYD